MLSFSEESDVALSDFRWPAEWEPHRATWGAWPVNPNTWPGIFERIPKAYARMIAAICCFEPCEILLSPLSAQEAARRLTEEACEAAGAEYPCTFHDIPVNDSWCRDHGPMFLNRRSGASPGESQVVLDWGYNSWGGKYPPWEHDEKVASAVAAIRGVRVVRPGVVLEGGAVEGNGAGSVMTTTSCLLNPNRNGPVTRPQMNRLLADYMQAQDVIWLPGHGIVGDDTDGHIDQVARFAGESTVVAAVAHSEDAAEAPELRANLAAVESVLTADGNVHEVRSLPLPPPRYLEDNRLPASYCNYCVVNGGIIVPTFRAEVADDRALQILSDCFPDRRVVGVDALDLIWGLGAFHCLTQQEPLATG